MMNREMRRKKLREKRHLIGGILLVGLLFGGHYLPESLTLLIMVAVTWLAMVSAAGLGKGVAISLAGFLLPFSFFACRDWITFQGGGIGLRPSVEISLELTVLCSMVYGPLYG